MRRAVLSVAPAGSVRSPRAPGRTANTGRSGARPLATMCRPFGEDRRRCGDLRAATELPQLAAGLRIVATHEVRRVGDELRARARVDDRRRPPRRQLLPIRLPHRLSGLGIQREQERVGLRVALHDHQAVPDDRRAGGPPLVRRDVVGAHVDTAKIDGPAQAAVEVVGIDPLRSEPGDDDAAVGGGRAARVGGLDVPLVARLALRRRSLPADPSGALVDRVQHPAMRRSIVRRIAVAVEAGLERGVGAAADGARHEEHVAPDDRAGVRKPGNRPPPQDVRAGGRAPVVRQVLFLGAAGRFVSAERWPVAGAARRRRQCALRRAERGARCGALPSPVERRAATTGCDRESSGGVVQASAIRVKLTRAPSMEKV